VDRRIQQSVVANLRARPAAIESGPFVLGLDPATTSPNINYATPRPDAEISAGDVEAMIDAFRRAERKPRLEYVTSTAPGLEELLLNAGFEIEERQEFLTCTREDLIDTALTLHEPRTRAERFAMYAAQNEAFGGEPTATDADVDRLLRVQQRGGVALMAIAEDGACMGAGMANPPVDGVSEISGIAVRAPFRRRGLGGAITAAITRRLFDAGADLPWLEASGADSWRVYERIGFRPSGQRLYISLNERDDSISVNG
jgi:ribosomal protein S18 acetylase RimI-like enzyme